MSLSPVSLSVITPVYNAAAWLPEYLQSMRQQSLQDWQLICVDDGSADDSLSLLRAAAEADSRLLVLHQENAGPSAARNVALEQATGRYITFVDADDTLEPDYLQAMLEAAESQKADVVVSGWTCVGRDGWREVHAVESQKVRCLEASPAVVGQLPKHACARLYARHVWQQSGARFPENLRYGEDTVFHYCLYPYCRRVARIPHTGYLYRASSGSLSAHARELSFRMVEGAEYLEGFYGERGMLESQRENLLRYAIHALRRVRSMAPPECQREVSRRLRALMQRIGVQVADLTCLRRRDARLLARILKGKDGPGWGWYVRRLSRWLRGK